MHFELLSPCQTLILHRFPFLFSSLITITTNFNNNIKETAVALLLKSANSSIARAASPVLFGPEHDGVSRKGQDREREGERERTEA